MNLAVQRLGRVTSVALLIAACWSAALIVGAFFVPAYQSAGEPPTHAGTELPNTLVGVNGLSVVAVISVPLLATLAAGGALWLGSRRGAFPLAWVLTGLLAVFNLLSILSVGIFVLPVTAALIVACATCRSRSGPPAPSAAAPGR